MTFIVRQSEAAGCTNLGGKAGALAALSGTGLPIPEWFVVLPDAYGQSQTGAAPQDDGDVRPNDAVRSELAEALAELCPDRCRVAVRSSACDEDGTVHSFAGQLDSFLFVESGEVADRVADVWRSGFGARVRAYRSEHGLSLTPQPPAVLVQRMVNPSASGVAFGADPVSGDHGVVVVAAVYGLGTALVSGDADADTYRIDWTGKLVGCDVAQKHSAVRFDQTMPGGVAQVEIEGDATQARVLSDEDADAVASLVRAASIHFGMPQDIEWAIENGIVYLLQSRPITSLASPADPRAALAIWDNSNIAESYSGVTTPLTFSFAKRAYTEVYRQFLHILGVPDDVISVHDETLERMIGLIQGRIYYNLVSWYRLLSLLPGFRLNRRFMEQMMGVKEEMPAEALSTQKGSRWHDTWRLVRSICGLIRSQARLNKSIKAFYARVDSALAPGRVSLEQMRSHELARHYRDLERRLLRNWNAPLENDFFAMIYFGVLGKLTERWCGDDDGSLRNDLLRAQGGIVSTEPARRVREMAQIAAGSPELVALLCSGEVDDVRTAIAGHAAFCDTYQEYLAKFSDRCMGELKLESATLSDDPLPLLRSVGQLALVRSGLQGTVFAQADPGKDAQLRALAVIGANPLRRGVFGLMLANARARIRSRENLRFERTRLFGRARQIFTEIGKRFAAAGALESERDVFYLEVDEVLGYIDGTATTADLFRLAQLRRAEFGRYEAMQAPADRFETLGIVHRGNTFGRKTTLKSLDHSTGDQLTGIGCCPGVVRGPVRLVRDPANAAVKSGEILVAARTDPGWIVLFAAAAGLLVERGSLLSHSAIVSREMGIPAIVSVAGVMDWVKDGDWVEMDGGSGIVRRAELPSGKHEE